MYTVYVLYNQSKDKIYIGQTSNLEIRILTHNQLFRSKKSSFTSKFIGEWKVIYKERYNTRSNALKREKQLKSYQGRKFINTVLGR